MRVALFVLFFAIAVFAQTATDNEVKNRLDTFQTDTATIIILIPNGGAGGNAGNLTSTNYATGPGITGNERDLTLIVDSGDQNLVLTTGVSDNQYTASTPNGARGYSILTLDGTDGSPSVNYNGLGGIDLTAEDAFAFQTVIQSDQPTQVYFDVYSGSANNVCEYELQVPGDDTSHQYIINYSQFSNGCTWSNVGAFQITVIMFDNVDVIINEVDTIGPVNTCICNCPVFSCRIYYDPDDDTFSYFRTSQFGVFNPTTDFSTVNGPPPPNASPSSTRRPVTNSASSTTLTNSNTNSRSTNSNSNNNNNSNSNNSSASTIAISLATIALFVALLF